jgi:hypothetical protein
MKVALANKLWPDKPDVFKANFTEMAGMDTIHDFWQGARGAKNKPSAEEKDSLRATIDNLLATSIVGRRDQFMQGISHDSPGWEPNMVAYFEDTKIPRYLFGPHRTVVTYDEILAGKHNSLLSAFGSGGNILEIVPGTTEFDRFDAKALNTIGSFVLNYMYPGQKNLNGGSYGVAFDALQGVVRDIFDGIGVYNQMYPQSIADSAGTNFEALSRPDVFKFPESAALARSNVFTDGVAKFEFVNNNFGKLNKTGFGLKVTNVGNTQSATLSFLKPKGTNDKKSGELQGPSVNYLLTSMTKGVDIADSTKDDNGNLPRNPSLKPVLALFGGELQKKVLLDFKRLGDYEQVFASTTDQNVIMSTGDYMCSLYSRLQRKSCIFVPPGIHSKHMTLYRFSTVPVSPEVQTFQFHISFAQENLARIGAIERVVENQEDLNKVLADFTNGQGGYYVSDTSSETIAAIDGGFVGQSTNAFQDKKVQFHVANALTTYVMRLRMKDALTQVGALQAGLQSARASLGENYKSDVPMFTALAALEFTSKIEAPWRVAADPQDPTIQILLWTDPATNVEMNVSAAVQRFQSAYTSAQGLVDFQLSNSGIFTDNLFSGNVMKKTAANLTFKIGRSTFDQFNKTFRELVAVINPSTEASSRISERNRAAIEQKRLDTANSALAKFYNSRYALVQTFSTEASMNEMESLVDAGDPFNTIEDMRAGVLRMVQNVFNAAPKPLPMSGGGSVEIVKADFAQFRDLAMLFREVCGAASAHVESLLTQAFLAANPNLFPDNAYNPGVLMGVDRSTPLNVRFSHINNQETLDAMGEIAYHWQTGLLEIKENAEDMYGVPYQPSETDALLNFIFSFKSLPDLTREFDPYVFQDIPPIASFVGGIMLKGYLPEVKLMILLAVFDNELKGKGKVEKYLADLHPWRRELSPIVAGQQLKVDAASEWRKLSDYVQSGIQIIDRIGIANTPPPPPTNQEMMVEEPPAEAVVKRRRIGGNKRTWRNYRNPRTTRRH